MCAYSRAEVQSKRTTLILYSQEHSPPLSHFRVRPVVVRDCGSPVLLLRPSVSEPARQRPPRQHDAQLVPAAINQNQPHSAHTRTSEPEKLQPRLAGAPDTEKSPWAGAYVCMREYVLEKSHTRELCGGWEETIFDVKINGVGSPTNRARGVGRGGNFKSSTGG